MYSQDYFNTYFKPGPKVWEEDKHIQKESFHLVLLM